MSIVTRFAPSPTGSLHIGGARTALFNYLWARRHGGKFLLRIEDTDDQRNLKEVEHQIDSSLRWLGLDWDGDTHHQSAFAPRHAEVIQSLLANGCAYRCYMDAAETEKWRAANKGNVFRSPYRNDTGMRDMPSVVRMKVPSGTQVITDHVQGSVKVDNDQIEDFVISRTDGSPTFLLAGAVDDRDMGVNWVIRGDDHLNNAFKQALIYRAMGWDLPEYAHVPLIHNAGGQKYSKRDGAAGVDEFAAEGVLPDALFNYLLRLGWGHGNDEVISREQAVEWFDIAKVGKNPAKFDQKKLDSLNTHYLRAMSPKDFATLIGVGEDYEWLMPEVQKRAHSIGEAKSYVKFLHSAPEPTYDWDAYEITGYLSSRARHNEWNQDALKEAVEQFCASYDKTMRDIAGRMRWQLVGGPRSLSIFDILVALGPEESIKRLKGSKHQPESVF